MWRATLKSLFARKVRLALTALSIVLGVGFVAGTFVLTDTLGKAFDDLFKTVFKGSDVVVQATAAFRRPKEGADGRRREPSAIRFRSLCFRPSGPCPASPPSPEA